ncbi:VOC family protein [Gordonia jinhuaensis]|uniref:VOC domain-containing protein n=1 Tax=Gordonia jinhuaensis TaxID=1517702 RepID=A0A916TDL3_9ACTN|nr:VOC family protein [Gordonia jinhuaensis]GGB39941.1 hypothetical protein GCM10011489_29450 [Gordonia jinhuaensis]
MTLSVGMITVDSADPVPLAQWWATAIKGTVLADNDGWFVIVGGVDGQPRLGFQKVYDPTPGKNRMHIDFTSTEFPEIVERLVTDGATKLTEHEMGGFAWVTMADPDGNVFCVSGGE